MTRYKLWYADNLKKGKAQGVEDCVRFLLPPPGGGFFFAS